MLIWDVGVLRGILTARTNICPSKCGSIESGSIQVLKNFVNGDTRKEEGDVKDAESACS